MENKYIYNSSDFSGKVVVNNEIFGDKQTIIAGPCTFGSYEEIYNIAKQLKSMGINLLRAGAFKGRTDPYSFQGLQEKGMKILLKIKEELKIGIVTELMTIEQVRKYGHLVDIIQIGCRNMYNYELLKEVGKINTPVILKRGFNATYREWLLAAEYILKEGNHNVILCERGIRNNYDSETRNVLDIQAVPFIKNNSKLPIIVDPSHASGKAYFVVPMSKAALTAGADGLIIETHSSPKDSLCDSEQTIDIEILKKIIKFKEECNK